MLNDNHRIPFERIRQPSRLDKAEATLTELIDFTLALAAMSMEAGTFTQEQLFKMESIIKDARRKLGSAFTLEDGMQAVRAAFRIELQRGKNNGK